VSVRVHVVESVVGFGFGFGGKLYPNQPTRDDGRTFFKKTTNDDDDHDHYDERWTTTTDGIQIPMKDGWIPLETERMDSQYEG